jgi:hypothetical protein
MSRKLRLFFFSSIYYPQAPAYMMYSSIIVHDAVEKKKNIAHGDVLGNNSRWFKAAAGVHSLVKSCAHITCVRELGKEEEECAGPIETLFSCENSFVKKNNKKQKRRRWANMAAVHANRDEE